MFYCFSVPATIFVPVYPVGLLPQETSCKLLIEYIYIMLMNVGSIKM